MTQLKDTLEVGTHPAESVASQPISKSRPDSGHSRSDAVSLEVPVKVHGSRVTEAARGTTPRSEPFEEQTTTMIVFPQGGVLRMVTAVVAGQAVVLTNLRSQQDAICRILKVRAYSATQSYVEVEFTNRQPGYWGVFFPSDGADGTKVAAPVASAPMPEVSVHIPANAERRAPEISMPAAPAMPVHQSEAPAPVKPVGLPQSKLPESHFVSIGAHEEVQPSASATSTLHSGSAAETDKKARFAIIPKQVAPIATPIVPPSPVSHASLSMAELRGDAHPAPSVPAPSSAAPVHSESSASTVLDDAPAEHHERAASGASHASKEMFGVRLDSSIGAPAGNEASQGTNWILLGAAAALALALAGGGLYYYSTRSARSAANSIDATSTQFSNSNSNTTADALPVNPSAGSVTAPIEQPQPPADANPPAVSEAHAPSEPAPKLRASLAAPAARPNRTSSAAAEAPQPSALEHPVTSSLPSTFGALNARPVTSAKRNADVGAAPSLDAGEAPTVDGALGTIAAPTLAAPEAAKPAENAAGPVRVGGNIKPPKIISSTLPDYPSIARNAGVEGAVVVEVVIDKTGKVTNAHAVSGPSMLRQPALDAIRRWKYQPSLLDGDPISVEMLVTIQFHR